MSVQGRVHREGFWSGAAVIVAVFEGIFEVLGAILGASFSGT